GAPTTGKARASSSWLIARTARALLNDQDEEVCVGGPATFSGTSYQSRVIALAYCHIIAEAPLGWFGGGDVPTSIVPETGGPGDDFLAECGPTGPRFEVQVKHGLSG